jgi:hypothetical protein
VIFYCLKNTIPHKSTRAGAAIFLAHQTWPSEQNANQNLHLWDQHLKCTRSTVPNPKKPIKGTQIVLPIHIASCDIPFLSYTVQKHLKTWIPIYTTNHRAMATMLWNPERKGLLETNLGSWKQVSMPTRRWKQNTRSSLPAN